jgi:ribosomal protein L7/L12
MSINLFQREAIFDAFRKTFPHVAEWEMAQFVNELERVLEFAPANAAQVDIYKTAREYEFVLKNFFQTGHKIQAIKFVRQVHNPTPGLKDAKEITEHFWNKFRREGVQLGGQF